MRLGIRLQDVNAGLDAESQSLKARAETARAEGFSSVSLELSGFFKGPVFQDPALTEGLALYVRRAAGDCGLDIAALECDLNLAHPNQKRLREIQERYFGHLRAAARMGAGVVSTKTGAMNPEGLPDEDSHTEAALQVFIRGLAPVVEEAERRNVPVAIQPMWEGIVYHPAQARRVLRSVASPNLRVVLDPVGLLGPESEADRVTEEALDLLGEHIAVLLLNDFTRDGEALRPCPAGTGEMDYTRLLRFMKAQPYVQAVLVNTGNETAPAAREFLRRRYEEA